MKKELQQAPPEKLTVTLDGDLARRLRACAGIIGVAAEELISEALREYFELRELFLRDV